jgi:hypothetical protein
MVNSDTKWIIGAVAGAALTLGLYTNSRIDETNSRIDELRTEIREDIRALNSRIDAVLLRDSAKTD